MMNLKKPIKHWRKNRSEKSLFFLIWLVFQIIILFEKRNKKEDKGFGVPYEDYTNLGERVGKMENSMGLIIGKVNFYY